MSTFNGKVIRAVRLGDSDAGRVVGKSLKSLRELAGLTQAEMARRLNIGQASISKIEHRGDVHILSLQRYVEALGGQLRIEAAFARDHQVAAKFSPAFEHGLDDNQLVFPIFGDELFRPQRDMVLSIRPQYSDKIMQGVKTVELRRRFPVSAPRGTIAYIYSTSPVQALVGRAEISNVVKLPVSHIWKRFGKMASIRRSDFDGYFSGLDEGFALMFTNARPLERRLELPELRSRFGFEPPQSFVYATPVLRKALQDEFPSVSY
jgi:predicted transcriptional regulator/DNA-binding XRE family transcriptional regulator